MCENAGGGGERRHQTRDQAHHHRRHQWCADVGGRVSQQVNRAQLLQGIAELDQGKMIIKTMEELEEMAKE